MMAKASSLDKGPPGSVSNLFVAVLCLGISLRELLLDFIAILRARSLPTRAYHGIHSKVELLKDIENPSPSVLVIQG